MEAKIVYNKKRLEIQLPKRCFNLLNNNLPSEEHNTLFNSHNVEEEEEKDGLTCDKSEMYGYMNQIPSDQRWVHLQCSM